MKWAPFALLLVLWACAEVPPRGGPTTTTNSEQPTASPTDEPPTRRTSAVGKLDQSLLTEVAERRRSLGASEDLGGFPVLIELVEELATPSSGSREEKLSEMKRLVEESQAALVGHLESLGVTDFESLVLSNSLATELTLEQIESVARRSDVRKIRLRRIEKVTTATR